MFCWIYPVQRQFICADICSDKKLKSKFPSEYVVQGYSCCNVLPWLTINLSPSLSVNTGLAAGGSRGGSQETQRGGKDRETAGCQQRTHSNRGAHDYSCSSIIFCLFLMLWKLRCFILSNLCLCSAGDNLQRAGWRLGGRREWRRRRRSSCS